mmetsp:Transcript_11627/g.33470  ORF Transcript_11627/g.33470 Transcript_11627/m.33470 type:complete len:539 (-) Transcript_11627:212-1828(-)
MRLFLHGRMGTPILLERIEKAKNDEIENKRSSTLSAAPSSFNSSFYHSSLLLSNWNMLEIDPIVIDVLESFVRMQYRPDDEEEQNPPRSPLSSRPGDNEPMVGNGREVILHNCEGSERLEHLIVFLMETNSSLTVRYDMQRDLPIYVARGLKRGAKQIRDNERDGCCFQLRSLTLKGTTLTPQTADCLEKTLSLLSNLEELTLRGNFTLQQFDHKKSSIMGRVHSEMMQVADSLHNALRSLPRLKELDLQQCHLRDEFLADLLDALHPESIRSLNLNGNMVHEESQHVLHKILSHCRCGLSHLDLSWQRLPKGARNRNRNNNHSILDLGILPTVLADQNTSLRTLNLSENILLDEDVDQLAVVLSSHPNLSRVYLIDCFISDEGLIALAQILPKCRENLIHLYLYGRQNIDCTAMVRKELYRGLLRNFYLKELGLPDGLRSKTIDWTLELNRAGRRALLDHDVRNCPDPAIECTLHTAPSFDSQSGTSHVPCNLWPHVLARANRVATQENFGDDLSQKKAASTIYMLIREKGYHALLL